MNQSRKPTRIISIDTETTGLDVDRHQMLSLGMIDVLTNDSFYVEIEWKEVLLCIQALKINKFDFTKEHTKPDMAAQLIYEWLCKHGLRKYDLRAMGKQAHWDKLVVEKFISGNLRDRVACDKYENLFIHRVVDLNSIMAFLAEINGIDAHDQRDLIESLTDKRFRELWPIHHILGEHHALYDARWNVCCLEVCKNIIKDKGGLYERS